MDSRNNNSRNTHHNHQPKLVLIFKKEEEGIMKTDNIEIPTSILYDRTLSVLEALTEYLKESKNLTYHEIALLLNRDDRTIWTCYNRAQKKRKAEDGTRTHE